MKIGYKGLNKNMESSGVGGSTKGTKYEFNTVYERNSSTLRLCSSDGFHFCNRLTDVYEFYRKDGSNRFFKIEILGDVTDGPKKSITNKFRIIQELTDEGIKYIEFIESDIYDVVSRLSKHPNISIAGSFGLYLHGCKLERYESNINDISDLDIVIPYYIDPSDILEQIAGENSDLTMDFVSNKASANDFDYVFSINGITIDVKIDPSQKYQYVNRFNTKFRVSSLLHIIEAKCRYALQGNSKHANDLNYMLVGKTTDTNTSTDLNDIFK